MKMKVNEPRASKRRRANKTRSCVGLVTAWCCVTLLTNLVNLVLCNGVKADDGDGENNSASTIAPRYANESLPLLPLEDREDAAGLVWSQLLEDYVLSQSSASRAAKDLPYPGDMHMGVPMAPYQMMVNPGMGPNPSNPQPPLNYHSSVYKRPSNNVFISKRIGEAAVELEPHQRPPAPVVNPQFRPMSNQMQHHHSPDFAQKLFGGHAGGAGGGLVQPQPLVRPLQQLNGHHQHPQQTFRAVSENDLYLLGAIEKLVYRVDYLESRVRRTEQLIYYLMAGNKQQEVRAPCPANFTRISDTCYYINSYQQVNWKTANSACKALNAHLAEFEKVSENEDIMAFLLNQPNHRGHDYWLGGLNPGLLWIWSNSAKPVNPNMNLTSIAMSHKQNTTKNPESNDIDTDADGDGTSDKKDSGSEAIINNTIEIPGQGRCLRLSYNGAKHSYQYHGQECTTRHNYICELEDKTLDNKITKIARELNLI